MSATKTALDRLTEAVHDYFDSIGLREGTYLTGWAVVASTGRIQSEHPEYGPMVPGFQYVMGEGTSPMQAAGLARFLDVAMERVAYQMLTDPGEDDDDDEDDDA